MAVSTNPGIKGKSESWNLGKTSNLSIQGYNYAKTRVKLQISGSEFYPSLYAVSLYSLFRGKTASGLGYSLGSMVPMVRLPCVREQLTLNVRKLHAVPGLVPVPPVCAVVWGIRALGISPPPRALDSGILVVWTREQFFMLLETKTQWVNPIFKIFENRNPRTPEFPYIYPQLVRWDTMTPLST